MTTAQQTIHDALPLLRTQYADRLRTQCGELLDFVSRCERGRLSEEAREEARLVAHSLCGTGTTFGFPEVSDAARYLENALDCGLASDEATFIDLTLKLIRTCDAAARRIEGEGAPAADDEPQDATLEKPSLLFVGLNPATTAVLRELLQPEAEIRAASGPADAGALIGRNAPAAIVFDMRADDPSATTALQAVWAQARACRAPMIVLVASRQSAAIAHAVSDGAIRCIVGAAGYEKVYDAVRAVLERDRRVVLIGDDDAIVRNIIANRFRMHGFTVINASDGAQVVDLAGRHRPSIIVLDRIMPGPEGVAVLQMLKANPATQQIPVVMLTSKRRALEVKEARNAGAAEYIVKPFRPEHVVTTCMNELGLAS